jgi:exopolysaccharide biosynthesis protein
MVLSHNIVIRKTCKMKAPQILRDTKINQELSTYDNFLALRCAFVPLRQKKITSGSFRPLFMKFCIAIYLLILSYALHAQIPGFHKIKWEREKLAPGLIWKSSHTVIDDTIPQNINLLVVNLRSRKISIAYNPKKNAATSIQATESGAIAAVNAGFFNIKEGGSATYIRIEGKIFDTDTVSKWPKSINMTGAVLIDSKGHILIQEAKSNSWFDSHPEFPYVLVTGPLLLKNNQKSKLPETSLVITKHPRTSIGVIGSHKIVFVTLDGRTSEARGMTLLQLSDLMKSLGCHDAVNLDGGGSTTMWIRGKSYNGVVNMPCDNKRFDHEGERKVSDILIIK